MKPNWKLPAGIILVLAVLFALQFAAQLWMLYGGYGMMRSYGYGYGMPMMAYGYGMTPFHGALSFGMLLMWCVPLGILILIIMSIMYLWKKLTEKPE